MKRHMRRMLSSLLVLVLSFGMLLNVQAETIQEKQEKAAELEKQKKQTEEEKATLTEKLNDILASMKDTEEKKTKKEEEIDAAEEKLTQAKIDEDNQYQSMKKRIVFMYENGNVRFFEILLDSKTITDFLNKAEYVSEISKYDREMLKEFQATVKKVEEQEAALKKEYEELSALQTELSNQEAEVNKLLEDTDTKLADLESQIGENAAELEQMIKEAKEAEEKRKQAAAAAAGSSATWVKPGASVVSGNGTFAHPCPSGYITSYFGEYRSPSDPAHKGMDFGTNGQAVPTYAAADGTVVIAGWSNSAGNWVVINHGNGIVTKYMHHSALCVTAGQKVTKGQQLGLTGTTGNSTGVHLHFQVEVNGKAVDPRTYL